MYNADTLNLINGWLIPLPAVSITLCIAQRITFIIWQQEDSSEVGDGQPSEVKGCLAQQPGGNLNTATSQKPPLQIED